MRLGILIRDEEYRNALINKLSSYDNDLYVNIIGKNSGDASDCLILTDVAPEEFDRSILAGISARTVFLSSASSADDAGPGSLRRVFKYSSVNSLLSELSYAYNEWRGNVSIRTYSARLVAVCGESDICSAEKAGALARQIIYRQGGRVLLMSLGYINDHGRNENDRINRFARMMYAIRTGRESASDSFTYTDSYGVSVLMLPEGVNPVAGLGGEELRSVITGLSGRFDTLILDIGTCFREENMTVMKEADSVVCFVNGRRFPGLAEMIKEVSPGKTSVIRLTGDTDEALAMDDCIRNIYGKDNTWERQEPGR